MHASIAGFYLGYESKDRHRVWVERSFKEFQNVTRKGGDYQTLAIKLLEFFFWEELKTPEYCCTQSKEKTTLDQVLLRGIKRVYIHSSNIVVIMYCCVPTHVLTHSSFAQNVLAQEWGEN